MYSIAFCRSPSLSTIYSDIAISHRKEGAGDPDRNLRIYRKMIAEGKPLEPRQQYYYGRELYYHGEYEEAISVFERFLLEEDGWIENKIEAQPVIADAQLQKRDIIIAIRLYEPVGALSFGHIQRRLIPVDGDAAVSALQEDFSGRFRHSVADFPAVHKLFVEKDMISAFFEKRKEVF
mgnify:CR=1 FL=1